MNRRDFLRLSAGGSTLAFVPGILRGDQERPSERINIGMIGLGGQGNSNLGKFIKNTVAVCDVDRERLGKAKDRVEKATGRGCAVFSDYRKLLEMKDLDAVVVSTPDHWHALISIHACNAGKHVYVEKPLTLTVAEGRAMVQAARRSKTIVQTGSQQRSDAKFRLACALVRSGAIGKVHTVKVGLPGPNFKGPAVPDSQSPAHLDYDFWLGPAPARPYNEKRVHYLFRFFWDYSGGQMTNWGAHHLDIAQWGLGMDESGPLAVEGNARFHAQKWFETPEWFETTYEYEGGIKLLCGNGQRGGTTFVGEKGSIWVNRGKLESDPKDILASASKLKLVELYVSGDHQRNWLDCIRSGKLPICDVEIGHRSATVCHLGNIAVRLGRKIRWDPKSEKILEDADASAMLSKPYRAPWKLA